MRSWRKKLRREAFDLSLRQFNIGNTPLLEFEAHDFGLERIFVKDEGANDFGTFKSRKALYAAKSVFEEELDGSVAITSGNYGYALSRIFSELGFATALIVDKNLDDRITSILSEKAILIPVDLDDRLLREDDILELAKSEKSLRRKRLIDTTNACEFDAYSSIFYEIDECLNRRGKSIDYVVLPVGGGGGYSTALEHYCRQGSIIGESTSGEPLRIIVWPDKNNAGVIGVTTDNPNSIADMLYAKFRPGLYPENRRYSVPERYPNTEMVYATEQEIREFYEWCQSKGIKAEPSAAAAFVALQRHKFNPTDTVVVLNTGDGRSNFQ